MEAVIKSVKFSNEYESKFGTLYGFIVKYDDKEAYYSSKSKDQKKFVEGQKAEFTEETRIKGGKEYFIIKPVSSNPQSNFGKNLKREQARYTTMAASYVKDLIIAGKIDLKDWMAATEKIVRFMIKLDKEFES